MDQPDRYEALYESEEAQLGEPALSALAMRYPAFLHTYSRFLDLWDLDHGVHHSEMISFFLKIHGVCPEIEAILMKMVTKYGGDGDLIEHNARPFLEEIYGDFPESDLFRRMVTEMHADCGIPSNPSEKRYIFNYTPSWPELGEKAKTLLAELDAKAA